MNVPYGDELPSGLGLDDRFEVLAPFVEVDDVRSVVAQSGKPWFVVEAGESYRVLAANELLDELDRLERHRPIESDDHHVDLDVVLSHVPVSTVIVMPDIALPDSDPVLPAEIRSVLVDGGIPAAVVVPVSPDATGSRPDPALSGNPGTEDLVWLGGRGTKSGADPILESVEQPAVVKQYLLAETVRGLAHGQEHELRVTLGGSQLHSIGENAAAAVATVNAGSRLLLLVHASGSLQLTDNYNATVTAQEPGDRVTMSFAYRAVLVGQGRLEVTLLQGTEPVATLQLVVMVSDNPVTDQQRTSASAAVKSDSTSRNVLWVTSDGGNLDFYLALRANDFDFNHGRSMVTDGSGNAAQFVREFESIRGSRTRSGSIQEAEMRGLGSRLTKILPTEIRDRLWESRQDLEQIELFTRLAKWPWELCRLMSSRGDALSDRDFLAQRGMTRRRPNSDPPRSIRVDGRRLVSAPDYRMMAHHHLRAGTAEADDLKARFGFEPGATTSTLLQQQVSEGRFSIFHFAGHSVLDQADDGLGLPRLVLRDSRLDDDGGVVDRGLAPTSIEEGVLRDTAPLIVLNACATGGLLRSPDSNRSVGGFPDAFIVAGAGAFIGTHWEVEDEPAQQFAQRFYQEFLDNGESFSAAVSKARTTAAERSWSPSPLAYVAYGHPDAVAVDGAP